MNDIKLQNLIAAIEQTIGRKITSPRDFEFLSNMIFHRTKEHVSVSTLKRVWGYVKGYEHIRPSTLNVLCRFIGYNDMDHFAASITEGEVGVPSHILLGEHLYADEMRKGKCLRLTWAPSRVCDVRHEGEGYFVVTNSEQTKLTPGSTFRCHIIEQGRPMFINSLRFKPDQEEGFDYVAGLIGGVMYEEL